MATESLHGSLVVAILMLAASLARAGEVPFEVDLEREVAIVVNERVPESVAIGERYASLRGIPAARILRISASDLEEIGRAEFASQVLAPVAADFAKHPDTLYLVTTFGVPVKIADTDPSNDRSFEDGYFPGRDLAAVDQELALVPRGAWETDGILDNPYFDRKVPIAREDRRFVVGRLDGPTPEVRARLVDLALHGERFGLEGKAYLDTRGLTEGGHKDRDDRERLSARVLSDHGFPFHHDDDPEVLDLSAFDDVVLYFGWYTEHYSFTKNPAFRFPPGAVAVHLHSFSAVVVRSIDRQWVGPLLSHGATATVGTVYEPTTRGFPLSSILFDRLLRGHTLGESVAMADPSASWMAILLGDPLYAPFARGREADQTAARARRAELERAWREGESSGARAPAWRAARELASFAMGSPLAEEAGRAAARIEGEVAVELDAALAALAKDRTPERIAPVDEIARAWEGTGAGDRAARGAAGARTQADREADSLRRRAEAARASQDILAEREACRLLVRRHPLASHARAARERLLLMETDAALREQVARAQRLDDARRLYSTAENLRSNGRTAEARKCFERVIAEFSDTEYAVKARAALR